MRQKKYTNEDIQKTMHLIIRFLEQFDISDYAMEPFVLKIYSDLVYAVWRFQSTGNNSIPKILFSSMPKSGTKQVEQLFSILRYERTHASYSINSHDGLKSDLWEAQFFNNDLLIGRSYLTGHINASKYNTYMINSTGTGLILLLRNPIQSLVSWCFYIKRLSLENGQYVAYSSFNKFGLLYSDNNITISDENVRKFMIQTVYPRILHFIENWMQQLNNINSSQFALLSQEQMAKEPDLFYQSILKKIDFPADKHESVINKVKSLSNHNFRKGSIDEWKDFFSQEELSVLLPGFYELLEKYPKLKNLFFV